MVEGGDDVREGIAMQDPPEPHECPGLHTALECPDDAQTMVQEIVEPVHADRLVCNRSLCGANTDRASADKNSST